MEQSRWKYGNGIRNSSGECWGARGEQRSLQWKLLWCLLGCMGWCWVGFLPAAGVGFTRRTWMWVCISKMMLRGNFRCFLWYSWFHLFWICLHVVKQLPWSLYCLGWYGWFMFVRAVYSAYQGIFTYFHLSPKVRCVLHREASECGLDLVQMCLIPVCLCRWRFSYHQQPWHFSNVTSTCNQH